MPPSLDLYGAKTGNCLRTAIALEEAGLAFTPRALELSAGAHRAPAHLALNPRGRVPVLVVSGGDEDLRLTQSNAIQLWVDAQVPGVLLPREGAARAQALDRWLFIVTDVIALNNAAFRLRRAGLAKETGAPLEAESMGALAEAERFLEGSLWLAGDAFTLADIAAYTIAAHYEAALEWSNLPRLRRWFEMAATRPAVRQGMATFG